MKNHLNLPVLACIMACTTITTGRAETALAPAGNCLVLMVNDDGINSQNFRDLARHLGPQVELMVSAPAKNQSGMSSALGNWRGDLAVSSHTETGARHAYAIDASPVIAARFGLARVETLYGRKPDVLLSGPNDGLNQGNAARYSGTIGAAREGAGEGIWGLAISVDRDTEPGMSDAALLLSAKLVSALCASKAEPQLLNFNLPASPNADLSDIQIAPPSMNIVQMGFEESAKKTSVKVALSWAKEVKPGTDVDWLRNGKAVVTILPMEDQIGKVEVASLKSILNAD